VSHVFLGRYTDQRLSLLLPLEIGDVPVIDFWSRESKCHNPSTPLSFITLELTVF